MGLRNHVGHPTRAAASAVVVAATALLAAAPALGAVPAPEGGLAYSVGPITTVSVGCPGTGDVAEAVDPIHDFVYQEFEGCGKGNAIGFARSTNGGESYDSPVALPGSYGGWDPWTAVAPNGTVYAAFMNTVGTKSFPIVDVSHDRGRTFFVERSLMPQQRDNWGDADYIAVGSDGTLYVSWDYGPSNSEVREQCSSTGSCYATAGDVNVVLQDSTNGGRTFGPMSDVSPGFPDGSADEGALTIEPNGRIDVLYQDFRVTNSPKRKFANGYSYFTSSSDTGKTWRTPVVVGASAGSMTPDEWWNDGSIGVDSSGDLYAAWDTQGRVHGQSADIGWVSFSTDDGRDWSPPFQAPADEDDVPHIMEVVGAGAGGAYVAWLSDSDPRGYAEYLRTFVVAAHGGTGGWLSAPQQISTEFGDRNVFPGDTFGIATLSPTQLVLSWGSATPNTSDKTAVFAAPVTSLLP